MAVALVPGQIATNASTVTHVATLPSAATAGNLLVAWWAVRAEDPGGDWEPTGFTAIGTGPITGSPVGLSGNGGIHCAYKIAAGGEQAIAATYGGASARALTVAEFSGVQAFVTDEEHGSQGPASTIDTPDLTPASGSEVLLIGSVMTSAGANQNFTSTDGNWTTLADIGFDPRHSFAYRIVPAASGAYSYSATHPQNATFAGVIASFSGTGGESPPSVDVDILDPTGVLLVQIARPLLVEWRHELNRAGAFELWLDRNDVQATAANLAPGNIVRITATEIDADPIFEGVLETGNFDLISSNEEGGEILKFGGPGSLAVLKYALLWHEDSLGFGDNPFLDAGVWRFTNLNAAGNIIRRLVNEAQGRTPAAIPDVTMTFGQFIDTNANTWDEIEELWEGPIGSDVLAETLKFVDAAEFDVRMDPGFIFNAYRPGEMGTDRTSATFAADKVRFVRGVNIADELSRQMHERLWASHVVVRHAAGYTDVAAGSFPYRREAYLDQSHLASVRAGQSAAQRLIYGDRAQDQLTFAILPPRTGEAPDDALGLYWPGIPGMTNAKFWLGDSVTLHTGTDETDYDDEAMLVVAITFARDATGALAAPIIELNSPVVEADPTGALSTLPSGGAYGGGTGGGTTVPGPHPHDHGGLAGLADDDHTQYALVRSGPGDEIQAHGSMGATETFDPADGNVHTGTATADCTITITSPAATRAGFAAARTLELYVTQDGTGGHDLTWPGSVVWPGGVAPTVDTTAGTLTRYVLETLDGGTTWYGNVVGGGGSSVEELGDLGDVTLTSPAEDDDLRYNGSAWVNDARKWEAVTNGEDVFVWEDNDLVHEWST